MLDVTLRSDRLVKDLLEFLDAKVGRDRYVVAISADHGVCPLPEVARSQGKDAGRVDPKVLRTRANQFLNETFIAGETPADWIEAFVYPWIYLNRGLIKERKLESSKVEEALAAWVAKQPGLQTAYTRTRLMQGPFKDDPIGERVRRSFRPECCGEVTIVVKPYYQVTSLKEGTGHGTPYAYDTHVPLLIYGGNIAAKVCKDAVTPQAGVVILAQALGIKPPSGAEPALPDGVVKVTR
jgi:hypothetical protein